MHNLGTVQATLGMKIDGNFIAEKLGIEPDERDKRAMFYKTETVWAIRDALVERLQGIDEIATPDKPVKAKPAAAPAPAPAAKTPPATDWDDEDDDDL